MHERPSSLPCVPRAPRRSLEIFTRAQVLVAYPLIFIMNSQTISRQPTSTPIMQMTIEQAQASEQPERGTEDPASRLRGGGAAKGCLIGALSCLICCECMACCCDCVASIVCCPCEVCCSCCC
ncbi:hypothetical protein OPQ81_001323 [Rhizoctonia solani]|nr:hypothetical protein OPQ81_001323 [Rhizoctonia solani]